MMRLSLPRSLFGRTALLLFLVMGMRDLSAYLLFDSYTDTIRLQRQAGRLAIQAETLNEILAGMDDTGRQAMLARLAQGKHVRIMPDNAAPPGHPLPPERHDRLAELLAEQLGHPTAVRNAREGMWLRVLFAQQEYWLLSPRSPLERPFPWHWFAGIALMGTLSLAGAFLVVWHVNGPLRRLAEAATLLGQGKKPALSTTTAGPTEIRSLSMAFQRMMIDMQNLETNRTMLLAGISHDLRTPLARLRLSLEMDLQDPELREGMVQDIEEMGALLERFLEFARDEQTETVAKIDPNVAIDLVCTRYIRLGKELRCAITPAPHLALRASAWQRLVTNLVDNAVHYGGQQAIEVRTEVLGTWFRLRVMDRGPGIPPEERERMLRPFTRLDTARSGAGRAGLGLAIVERIAQLHGGQIILLGRSGGGLEARVELPCR
ncbi:MAG: two-component sensor histidine kinase [Magnetococcales bacterium]|nr:two-component sensor histidine kinase [Magnetococcales bacterium]